jgi:hypothetical protein
MGTLQVIILLARFVVLNIIQLIFLRYCRETIEAQVVVNFISDKNEK